MITMNRVEITRFRSILNLEFEIANIGELVSICGENNVGKTNVLRAIRLFFYPEEYDASVDRPELKNAQGGGSIDPKIKIQFYNDQSGEYFLVTRELKNYVHRHSTGLQGERFQKNGKKVIKASKATMAESDILDLLKTIEFCYIESININIPQLVEQLTEDIISVEYNKSRMTESKRQLKLAYDAYTSGLQEILDVFSSELTETFGSFRDNWKINFHVPASSETFRDLISDDIEFHIDDKGCASIEQKGSGLQRLAVILLHFEILKRLNVKKNIIVCIDEPDIYLHEGLQRKLAEFFTENAGLMQIICTTHSKVFINEYSMRNIILLGSKFYPQYSVRKKRDINVVETILIDITTDDGYDRICDHLGIEKGNYDILERHNLLVEGGCDKKYLEELGLYFGITTPEIIALHGVSNAEKYLGFYDSYYNGCVTAYTPKVKILFDNDTAGREAYNKIKAKTYQHIRVMPMLLQNATGDGKLDVSKNNTNHEIEDFIYPEILCYLVNELLGKKSMNTIKTSVIKRKIETAAFKAGGIMSLIEYEKNDKNPETGAKLSFVASGSATNDIKNGLAGMFEISGNRKLLQIMDKCKSSNGFVEQYLRSLFDFESEADE